MRRLRGILETVASYLHTPVAEEELEDGLSEQQRDVGACDGGRVTAAASRTGLR